MISRIATHQQKTLGEKRLTLHGLAWENYQQILQGLPESRAVRLIYDRGTLEFIMPLEGHEFASELIGVFIRVLVAAMGVKLKSMRSTTLARQDLDRGAEPDIASINSGKNRLTINKRVQRTTKIGSNTI